MIAARANPPFVAGLAETVCISKLAFPEVHVFCFRMEIIDFNLSFTLGTKSSVTPTRGA